MKQELVTDISKDDTMSHKWIRKHSDRLIAFEILRRYVLSETGVPMSSDDLYDKIGVSGLFIQRLITSIPERLNEQ